MVKMFLDNDNHLGNPFIWEFWKSWKFLESVVILGKSTVTSPHMRMLP